MARIQSSEQLNALVEKLFDKRITATIKLSRTEEGMEAEVTVDPTDELTSLAYSLVQSDLTLSYDGSSVQILTTPGGEK
jgi:hypothetical protein